MEFEINYSKKLLSKIISLSSHTLFIIIFFILAIFLLNYLIFIFTLYADLLFLYFYYIICLIHLIIIINRIFLKKLVFIA